jgi:CMP/dCMP kinase
LSTIPMTEPLVIAIDGPAGAGKSTVAQMLARRLGMAYVDSGATYRAAALKVLESGVSLEKVEEIVRVVGTAEIGFVPRQPQPQVLLDGKDVTTKIRALEVTRAASRVSRLPAVRRKLIALQRSLVKPPGVVMEGRDIGTVVFPGAPLKIFLKADPEERARRRVQQNEEQGRPSTLKDTLSEISSRDQRDAERQASPLVAAEDAAIIDTTSLSAEQVVERILELARKKDLPGLW